MELQEQQLNEKLKEALNILLENYWILKREKPKEYRLIRSMEKNIRTIVNEKLGYRFVVTTDFVKLEKIPVTPKSYMGIGEFTQTMDYVIFCCLLSVLEEKNPGEYFLLANICESIAEAYPEENGIVWENYNHRLSFVRVMKFALNLNLLNTIDGDIDKFKNDENAEVLYRSTVYSRYFMRPYTKDIYSYLNFEEFLEQENIDLNTNGSKKQQAYRQLFLQPVLIRKDTEQGTFKYLRDKKNEISEFIEKYTHYSYEIYKDMALLTTNATNKILTTFPTRQNIDDVLLHIAKYIRQLNYNHDEYGILTISLEEWGKIVEQAQEKYKHGWSKEFREEKIDKLSQRLLLQGEYWDFVKIYEDSVEILPSFAKLVGDYSPDVWDKIFSKKEGEMDE